PGVQTCALPICTQTITVDDTTPPAITCPPTLTLECIGEANYSATNPQIAAWLASATATDNCGPAPVTNNFNVNNYSDGCGSSGIQVVTFTATDACGLSSTCTAEIRIIDTAPPEVICPPDLTIACNTAADLSVPANTTIAAWLENISVLENCGSATVTSDYDPMGFSDGCGATGSQAVTWTVMDDCGMTGTCTATITIVDGAAPAITCPATLTIECSATADLTVPNNTTISAWLGSATATDACGSVTITNNYNPNGFSDGCGATGSQTVTFTAMDACDLTSTCTAVITIVDTTPPTITCPAAITVECDESILPAATGTATATDACTAVVTNITYEDIPGEGNCSNELTRVWTA